MNMMDFQLQHQDWVADKFICAAGVGNETCNADLNDEVNSYKQNEFTKNSSFTAVNNCGSRMFSHGTWNQTSWIDEGSGLSTGYYAARDDYLTYKSLQAPHPDGNGQALDLHPFPALKVLYNQLGATHLIPLGSTRQKYDVNQTAFVDLQYPIDGHAPTKQIGIPKEVTSTSREVVVWVCVVYALLLVFFVILAIGFGHSIHKARSQDQAKANHVLYDNLNPATSDPDKDP